MNSSQFKDILSCPKNRRLIYIQKICCTFHQHVHSCLELFPKPWHRQLGNVMGLDVLDNSTIGSTDDEWHAKLAAQESIQVARQNPISTRDDVQNIWKRPPAIHCWT